MIRARLELGPRPLEIFPWAGENIFYFYLGPRPEAEAPAPGRKTLVRPECIQKVEKVKSKFLDDKFLDDKFLDDKWEPIYLFVMPGPGRVIISKLLKNILNSLLEPPRASSSLPRSLQNLGIPAPKVPRIVSTFHFFVARPVCKMVYES